MLLFQLFNSVSISISRSFASPNSFCVCLSFASSEVTCCREALVVGREPLVLLPQCRALIGQLGVFLGQVDSRLHGGVAFDRRILESLGRNLALFGAGGDGVGLGLGRRAAADGQASSSRKQ